MRSMVKGLHLLTALLFTCASYGQALNLRFRHLGIADGLTQSSVYCLYQDSKGFVWIGTTDGLNRYDGYAFRHFKHDLDDSTSLRDNELLSLQEDGEGNLMIGTTAGLDLFDPKKERFSKVLPPDGDKNKLGFIHALFKDSRKNIWIGNKNGLMLYQAAGHLAIPVSLGQAGADHAISAIAEDKQQTLWIGYGNTVVHYDPRTRTTIPLPPSLANNPWLNKSRVCMLRIDSAQNVWIGTERDGLIVLHDNSRTVNYRSDDGAASFSNDMIRAIGFYNGNAWIGNRNGLYVITPNEKVAYHYMVDKYDPASLSGNSILCFMQDNAGSFWIGTFAGGVNIYQPGNDNFNYIKEQLDRPVLQPSTHQQGPAALNGLSYRVVSRIVEDALHNLWIATEGGGVNYYDRQRGKFQYIHINAQSQHGINQELVKSIQPDARNNLWIGTLEGLFYYDRTKGSITGYPLAENAAHMLDEQVYGLALDSGGLWIGTKGGLFHLDHQRTLMRFRHSVRDTTSLLSNDINNLMRDREGGIWVATEAGFAYLPKGATHFINNPGGDQRLLNRNGVLSIYEDNNGLIWVATRGGGIGVIDRRNNHTAMIGVVEGLGDDIVHGIIQDKQNNFWVSCSQSIARIQLKKKYPPFSAGDISVTNYSVNNGLGSNEFQAAVCRTSAGEILFGGVNGIVAFQPEKLVVNQTPPPVVLTDLLIKNVPAGIDSAHSPLARSITWSDTITLAYDQDYFTIRFAALNYINSKTNQYAYRLDGLKGGSQWYFVGNQQSATYTNLDPGDYVFKVKAANNDGVWNDAFTSLHISVRPPLWRTPWAYTLYILVIGALLYAFNYYSLKTARLRSDLNMQRINREKEQELMQRKLSFFTNISHEIKTPLTLILAPIEKLMGLFQSPGTGGTKSSGDASDKALQQLAIMQRNGERLLRLTNQLLDFRKLEAGGLQLQVAKNDLAGAIQDIVHSFETYAQHRDVQLTFHAVTTPFPAWYDQDKLEKMLFNLLSNAVKFNQPGGRITILLELATSQGFVNITVEDNGAGIAEQNLEKIFYPFHHYNDTGMSVDGTGIGLAFTKGLAVAHHGSISVSSRQATADREGYTCFTLTLPVEKDQYAPAELMGEVVTDVVTPDRVPDLSTLMLTEASDNDAEGGDNSAAVKPIMLIVEDNPEVLSFIKAHFDDFYITHTAITGKQGWETATTLIPDIIISDVMMPEMSGTELCRLLKKDVRTSHIPIILLTARTPLAHQLEGLETGADDYITKPFSLALLQVRVSNLLNTRRLLQERYRKDITLQPSNIAITPTDELFLSKLMSYIDDNLMEPSLNVEQLGKELAMSRVTFYRKIKALTNQSPVEFIRSCRLKKAALLLRSSQYTVNETAYMVGFSDVDYFRKWFKQEFGATPKEYAASGGGDKQ